MKYIVNEPEEMKVLLKKLKEMGLEDGKEFFKSKEETNEN